MSMWSQCTTVIDEPIKVFLWEMEDFQVILAMPFILNFATGGVLALALTIVGAIALYYAKRGKPSGALWHLLHWLELVPLAGVLPPHPQRYSPW